jgi:hypothetical protein
MTAGEKWDIALTIACAVLFLPAAACLIAEASKAAQALRDRTSNPAAAHAIAVQGALIERDPEEVLRAVCHAICDNGDAYDNDYHPVRLCDEVLMFYNGGKYDAEFIRETKLQYSECYSEAGNVKDCDEILRRRKKGCYSDE